MTRYSIRNCTAEKLKEIGASKIKQTHTGSVAFATLTKDQVEKLRSEGYKVTKVSYVKTDQITVPMIPKTTPEEDVAPPPYIEPPSEYTPSELIEALGFDDYREMMIPPLHGEGINIAVIDSGIRQTHTAIGEDRVIYIENFTEDVVEGDAFDHGTGVAEVVLTVAPEAKLLDMKIITSEGFGSSEDLVLAIDRCVELKDDGDERAPRIINLSLGADDDGDPDDPIRVVCREALDRGMWVVGAAGNGGPDEKTIMSPATEEYVLCVGSVDRNPIKASDFSSRGPTIEGLIKPDMTFFGDSIRMASSSSDTSYVTKSGTSFSAPFVSGIAGLHVEAISKLGGYEEVFPHEEMDERLQTLSTVQNFIDAYLKEISIKPTDDFSPDKDTVYGWGIPYGSYLSESYKATTPGMPDMSEIMTPMITILMVGMMFGMMSRIV